MKNNPTIDQLHQSGHFELTDKVCYHDLLPFLLKYLKPHSVVMRLFYAMNAVFLAFTLFLLVSNFIHPHLSFLSLLNYFGLAGLITIASIPVHELLHGLAFKLLGAGKLTFGANLKAFMFYVTSHRFILNKKQFYFLALVPFVVISATCFCFMLHPSFIVRWISANVLFAHATCCIGDFALLSYFQTNFRNHKQGYTYDDVTTMTSYFFVKKTERKDIPDSKPVTECQF